MGIFLILVGTAILYLLYGRVSGRKEVEEAANDTMRRSFDGARAIGTELFGSLGGQAPLDFGPVPRPQMDSPSEYHLRMEEPAEAAPPFALRGPSNP